MALLVHLTAEKNVRSIVRSGIKQGTRGVFCLPMLPSYVLSHQWLRELRRGGQRTIVAVDFRIPDDELVTVGHFNTAPQEVTAAQAISVVRELDDPRGYEIIVARAIGRREIHRVRHVNQVTGWRYAPGQNGRRPCGCPGCVQPGTYGVASIRARFNKDDWQRPTKPALMKDLAEAADDLDITIALDRLRTRSRGDAGALAYLVDHPSAEVREHLAMALAVYRDRPALVMLRQLATDPEADVREAATRSLHIRTGSPIG